MGVIDEKGNFIDQLQVFALLCLYLLEVRGERGPIIKTLTTTSMAYRLGEIFNVPVYQTAVGFKYVAPLMTARDAIIGGEESGGYGFRGHVPERDGILASLYFLDFMVRTGKSPSQLLDYLYSVRHRPRPETAPDHRRGQSSRARYHRWIPFHPGGQHLAAYPLLRHRAPAACLYRD
jgi:phosphomannomutase